MCSNHHDGTCTAVLARSRTVADRLEMKLVCESCGAVLKVIGSLDHKVEPLLFTSS